MSVKDGMEAVDAYFNEGKEGLDRVLSNVRERKVKKRKEKAERRAAKEEVGWFGSYLESDDDSDDESEEE